MMLLVPSFASCFALYAQRSGSFMVPLLSGPVPPEVLKAENPMQFMTEKVRAKHPSFRALEGTTDRDGLGIT